MKAIVVKAPNQLRLEDRPVPVPAPGEARVRVHACGVCHSDHFVTGALWPGLVLPRVPGHEVAGVVEALGEGVTHLSVGDRVGLGWHGGHDGTCDPCRRGRFVHCRQGKITGISFDGGYAEHVVAPAEALARIPDGMAFAEAAPLLCAGVTTFNALRNAGARPGDLVAVHGLGGLGHLGVQYARAMGFEVVALSRGTAKAGLAKELGAHHHLDASRPDVGDALQRLGGVKAILATAPDAASISALVPGLGVDGALVVVAAPFQPLSVGAIDLISRSASVRGWASGSAVDSTDAMAFAARHGVRAWIERFPLARAADAVRAMLEGTVRFRAVLEVV